MKPVNCSLALCCLVFAITAVASSQQRDQVAKPLPKGKVFVPFGGQPTPISVMLVSKNFYKADYLAGDAGDSIEFVLLFKSDLAKDALAPSREQ